MHMNVRFDKGVRFMQAVKGREIVGKTIIRETGVENEFLLSVGGLLIAHGDYSPTEIQGELATGVGDYKPPKPVIRSTKDVKINGKTLGVLPFENIEGKDYVELRILASLLGKQISRSSDAVYLTHEKGITKVEGVEDMDGKDMLCVSDTRIQSLLNIKYIEEAKKYEFVN